LLTVCLGNGAASKIAKKPAWLRQT